MLFVFRMAMRSGSPTSTQPVFMSPDVSDWLMGVVCSFQAACRHCDGCFCEYRLLAVGDAPALHAGGQPDHQGSAQRSSVLHHDHAARPRHLCLRPESGPPHWHRECDLDESETPVAPAHTRQPAVLSKQGDTMRTQQSVTISGVLRAVWFCEHKHTNMNNRQCEEASNFQQTSFSQAV